MGQNLFISNDRPPPNPCWGLIYRTCEFLGKLCSFKGTRRDFLLSISGRVNISLISTRVNDSTQPALRHMLTNLCRCGQ